MTQSLWFFGTRFNILVDHTTTGGHYDLIECSANRRSRDAGSDGHTGHGDV